MKGFLLKIDLRRKILRLLNSSIFLDNQNNQGKIIRKQLIVNILRIKDGGSIGKA